MGRQRRRSTRENRILDGSSRIPMFEIRISRTSEIVPSSTVSRPSMYASPKASSGLSPIFQGVKRPCSLTTARGLPAPKTRRFPFGQTKVSAPCSTSSARRTPSIFFPLEFLCLLGANLASIAHNQKGVTKENARVRRQVNVQNRTKPKPPIPLLAILEVAELAFLGHVLGGE